jgi:hypothetical protein
MLIKGNEVLENIDEGNLSRELEIAKFRNYGRENFADLIRYKISLDDFIENTSQFYSIRLPKEISEYFLRFDLAPYFIMSDAPAIIKMEDILSFRKNEFEFVTNLREVKNYYKKWLVQKTTKEKHYFANSIINTVERNFAFQSFYNLLIYGIVLTYDSSVYNPKKAIEVYNRAKEIVNSCNLPQDLREESLYVLNLFQGFTYLKEYEYLNSLTSFKEALVFNPNGITAFFYCALSSRYIDDFDTAYDYLKEILEFDKARFKYAIDYNHLALFNYFYKNTVFYNVFTENGFAQLLPDIDFLIRSLYSGEINSMEKTYGKLINLDNLRIKDFFDGTVAVEIKFLKNALDAYRQKRTGLIRIVEQIFREKLITLIEYIRNLIETHYFDLIKAEIEIFDRQIDQNKRQLTRIIHEREDASKKIKMNLNEAAEYLEETITERSKYLEKKIENLDKDPKYNPSHVLYSSMLFTIMVSFMILVVVGIITAITGYGEELPSTQLALKTGLKWGGVTFAVGIFISIFTALSSFWEKSSERKLLTEKLKMVKETEATEREYINEDSERKALIYEQKFVERIKAQEKIIENFKNERQQNYQRKYNEARKEIDLYINPLNDMLKTLENSG